MWQKRTCMRSGYLDLKGGESWWPHTAAIWIQDAEETIMQYNAVYDTGRQPGNGDGFAYDFDFYCKRCIAQYNYSQNNHGFLLLMNRTFENIARYNISENDQTHLVQMQCVLVIVIFCTIMSFILITAQWIWISSAVTMVR